MYTIDPDLIIQYCEKGSNGEVLKKNIKDFGELVEKYEELCWRRIYKELIRLLKILWLWHNRWIKND